MRIMIDMDHRDMLVTAFDIHRFFDLLASVKFQARLSNRRDQIMTAVLNLRTFTERLNGSLGQEAVLNLSMSIGVVAVLLRSVSNGLLIRLDGVVAKMAVLFRRTRDMPVILCRVVHGREEDIVGGPLPQLRAIVIGYDVKY